MTKDEALEVGRIIDVVCEARELLCSAMIVCDYVETLNGTGLHTLINVVDDRLLDVRKNLYAAIGEEPPERKVA